MLDHVSDYPSPSFYEEREKIRIHFTKYKHVNDLYKRNINKFIDESFGEHVIIEGNKTVIKYSYTGWYIYGYNDVIKSVENKIILHKKNIKRKILGIMKSLTILYIIYKKTIDKLYSPEHILTVIKDGDLEYVQNNGGLDKILLNNIKTNTNVPPPVVPIPDPSLLIRSDEYNI